MPKKLTNINLSGNKVTNSADGTAATDLVTKQQIDALPSIAATITQDTWHTLGAAGEPALVYGPVTNYGSPYGPVRFRKTPDGRVEFKGLLTSSVALTGLATLFTMPVGYRPAPGDVALFKVATDAGQMRVDVLDDGTVRVNGGGSTGAGGYLSLNGLSFDTNETSAIASAASVSQEGWTAPTFLNSWTNVGSEPSVTVAGYRKDPAGVVMLKGTIKPGTAAVAAFQLPVGYRPSRVMRLVAYGYSSGGGFTHVACAIDTSGNVILQWTGTAPTEVSIDGVQFDAGQTTWPAGSSPLPIAGAYNLTTNPTSLSTATFQTLGLTADTAKTPSAELVLSGGNTITVNAAGWYQLNGWVQINPATTAAIYAAIVTSTGGPNNSVGLGSSAGLGRLQASDLKWLAAGTTVVLQAYCSTASGQALGGRLSIARIGV